MNAIDIEGTWRLIAWEQVYDDGRRVLPFGASPIGVITYLGDRMSAVLSRNPREPFHTGGQWDADTVEKAGAYDSCMAYAGTFSIEDGTVVHHVDTSLFPNWVGGSQRRRVEFDQDVLSLTARLEDGTPEARTAVLRWRRHRVGVDGPLGTE